MSVLPSLDTLSEGHVCPCCLSSSWVFVTACLLFILCLPVSLVYYKVIMLLGDGNMILFLFIFAERRSVMFYTASCYSMIRQVVR